MKKTKIEWCDSSWNPVTGCRHGCEYCYARRIAERFGGYYGYGCEEDFDRVEKQREYYLTEPAYNKGKRQERRKAPYPFGFEPTFHRYMLDVPEKWTKPRNIFVCSMADLFGEWVPDSWIKEVFAACERAPQHRYLFLTKNPERYTDLEVKDLLPHRKNMWYGISVTDAQQARRALATIENITTEAGAFLSLEPLMPEAITPELEISIVDFTDWVIIGAETGNRKGKVTPSKDLINKIKIDCAIYKKPLFMKDSLIPIVGEEGMRREFPWAKKEGAGNG